MPVPTIATRTDLSGLMQTGKYTRRPLNGVLATAGATQGATVERPTEGLLYPPAKRYGTST